MTNRIANWILVAGFIAMAVFLSFESNHSFAVFPDGWNREDRYPMTARMTLWLDRNRHF
jgi:hypothetical protein